MNKWSVSRLGAIVQLIIEGKAYDLPVTDARDIARELDQRAIVILRHQGHLPQKAERDGPKGAA